MKKKISILWVDDEIDLLTPYILFLEEKGYVLTTTNNGEDAIQMVRNNDYDLIFLDENMPGLSGIETLEKIKEVKSFIPVVMITKSEEEDIMELAIGSKIADYLIKPVNPNQILLSIKKNTDTRRLVSEKTTHDYQKQFGLLSQQINSARNFSDWDEIYRKIVFWELEFQESGEPTMDEVLNHQKVEANSEFSKFIKRNYENWFSEESKEKPILSPQIFQNFVFPLLEKGEKVFFILIDNLRFDQWKFLEKEITNYGNLEKEELYCGILPTATQYARNAMFAGLMPEEIHRMYPDLWVHDEEEGGKNLKEEEFLQKHLQRAGIKKSFHYDKVLNQKKGRKIIESFSDYMNYDLNVIVYNFVDMLSHARTDMEVIQELTNNEPAYRSLTASWFQHSYILELLKNLSGKNVKVIITTDHGSVRVDNPVKVLGDKKTSTNLRYKVGRNLNYNDKEVFEVQEPGKIHLPKTNISSKFIFAMGADFLVYPNNYNYYANYYKNTFQHGGVSMEEMIIPLIQLNL
ncbi:MAG: bifunctional response regulator/alkaline phosphatase family protein [Bacteroidales bacterium]|nr:bifunctional response regulator/alkaline phosphatase family protein [Bacteroidales bacterium]